MNTDGTVIVYDEATELGVILSHERQEKQYRFNKNRVAINLYRTQEGHNCQL